MNFWNLHLFKPVSEVSFTSVQFSCFSHVQLFATPWTTARQASLSITNSQSLPKLMSIDLVMPSNHLTLCRPLLLLPSIFPSIRVFSNESQMSLFTSGGQRIGASASTSVLPMNTEDWSFGWTGWISLQSKGLKRLLQYHIQKHQFFATQLFFFFIVQLSRPYMTTGKTIALRSIDGPLLAK